MGIVMENHINEDRYLHARKKVEKLKGFYWHFASYIIVNLFISTRKIFRNMDHGETFMEAFLDYGTFAVWIFWGIGIVFHALGVFGKNFFLGKDWEERKMNEFMVQDKQQWK